MTVLSVDRESHMVSPHIIKKGTLNNSRSNLFRTTVAQTMHFIKICAPSKIRFFNEVIYSTTVIDTYSKPSKS